MASNLLLVLSRVYLEGSSDLMRGPLASALQRSSYRVAARFADSTKDFNAMLGETTEMKIPCCDYIQYSNNQRG